MLDSIGDSMLTEKADSILTRVILLFLLYLGLWFVFLKLAMLGQSIVRPFSKLLRYVERLQ